MSSIYFHISPLRAGIMKNNIIQYVAGLMRINVVSNNVCRAYGGAIPHSAANALFRYCPNGLTT